MPSKMPSNNAYVLPPNLLRTPSILKFRDMSMSDRVIGEVTEQVMGQGHRIQFL
jgi:hypothetical protein